MTKINDIHDPRISTMPSLVLTKTWRSDQPLKPIARVSGGPKSLDGALLCCSDAAGDVAITLPHDAHMSPAEPTHDPAGRDCIYVAGPSGAGKARSLAALLSATAPCGLGGPSCSLAASPTMTACSVEAMST